MKSTVILLFLVTPCIVFAKLRTLDEQNWEQMLEGEWMVEFFAPWCPACRALESEWKDFATWSDDLGIKVGHVDVTTSPGLSGRFMVTALPTIYHVKNGIFRQYRGVRNKDEFISFVEEKKWEQVETLPKWRSPSSIQMSIISGFFKLSMMLRNVHTQITEEYGIPDWGSYIIFAVATIVIGAVLGLILVFFIDCFQSFSKKSTSKKTEVKSSSETELQEKDEDDIVDEDSGSEAVIEDGGDESQASEREEPTKEEKEEKEADEVEDQEEQTTESGAASSSPDVRRRRTRKAD